MNAGDNDAVEKTIKSMRNYVDVLLSQIYAIADWASKSGNTDENVMDRLRSVNDDTTCPESFRLNEDQKKLWDQFCNDADWREWWQEMNEKYREDEGFRAWSRIYEKLCPYDREESRREWSKSPAQDWTTEWATTNSWYLCIDSFRAWLRERGKFYGSEEVLENKGEWETDDEWHLTRHKDPRHKDESEADSFNAWMNQKGLENPDLQESTTKEQSVRFEEWRRSWLSDHPEAARSQFLLEEQTQWDRIGKQLEQEKNEENDKRKEKAQS